jgi:hypothetical protein
MSFWKSELTLILTLNFIESVFFLVATVVSTYKFLNMGEGLFFNDPNTFALFAIVTADFISFFMILVAAVSDEGVEP